MVYTVTLNPSLDYIIDVKDFKNGVVNRSCNEKINAGGKGLNVSFVLKNLGIESVALGFLAGFTGKEIERRLFEKGIGSDFVFLKKGLSRINVKLRSGEETEINGQGPLVQQEEVLSLEKKIEALREKDVLVLAGSIPSGLGQDFYGRLMKKVLDKDVMVVVDATKELLLESLEHRPFLVKPNNFELGEVFGVDLKTGDDVVPYAKKLLEMGAKNVLVSLAAQGAVLLCEDGKVYKSKAPEGKLVNSVGAGDSMVAGFIAGYLLNNDYEMALKMGVCAGTASACSSELATMEKVNEFLKQNLSLKNT